MSRDVPLAALCPPCGPWLSSARNAARNPPFFLYRGAPAVANAPERFNRIVLKVLDQSALLLIQTEDAENAVAGRDEIAAEWTKLARTERLVQLAGHGSAVSTFVRQSVSAG